MKSMVSVFLIFSAFALADETLDRVAIERVVVALNTQLVTPNDTQAGSNQKRISDLFTADAGKDFDMLSRLNGEMSQRSNQPMSEITPPRLVIQSVRFLTPEIAMVDTASTQYGSTLVVLRSPVLLVMKKEGAMWRIGGLRLLAPDRYLDDVFIGTGTSRTP